MEENILAGHKWNGPVADSIMGMHPLIFILVVLAIIALVLFLFNRRGRI